MCSEKILQLLDSVLEVMGCDHKLEEYGGSFRCGAESTLQPLE